MQVIGVGLTDVGKKRDHNEDSLLLRPELGLYMVADGMGGHAGGDVASKKAIEVVSQYVSGQRHLIERFDDTPDARDALITLVREAIEAASREIYNMATSGEGKAGMGTTTTLVLVAGDKAVMGHVGDSRLYLNRGGRIHQLSEDHSYISELVRRGHMTPEKAQASPYANMITRAVGIHSHVQVDTLLFDVLPGDTYLVCSDGLTRYVTDVGELAGFLGNDSYQSLPQQLIDVANDRGGRDNITCLVIRAEGSADDPATDQVRSTEVNLQVETLRFITLFEPLDMKELLAVLEYLRVERSGTGEVIVREGEASDSLYILVEGHLEVLRGDSVIAELDKGSHFGEMALLSQRPRAATVRATTPSRLLVLDRAAVEDLVKREPALGVKFLWRLAQVLSLRLDQANELGSPSPPSEAETMEIKTIPLID
jgi:serine/threonine protein phosphatase PrpC